MIDMLFTEVMLIIDTMLVIETVLVIEKMLGIETGFALVYVLGKVAHCLLMLLVVDTMLIEARLIIDTMLIIDKKVVLETIMLQFVAIMLLFGRRSPWTNRNSVQLFERGDCL